MLRCSIMGQTAFNQLSLGLRPSGNEATPGWFSAERTRPRTGRASALDARRGGTDHPGSCEGQELPLDTARPARRALPPLVPQRVRRDGVDASRLRGLLARMSLNARRQVADRRLRRRPPRRHRLVGRAFAANPAEGHVRHSRILELGRGTRPYRDLAGRSHQAAARRETRRAASAGSRTSQAPHDRQAPRAIVSRSSACSSSASAEASWPVFRFATSTPTAARSACTARVARNGSFPFAAGARRAPALPQHRSPPRSPPA
jgi:hypothetical protein